MATVYILLTTHGDDRILGNVRKFLESNVSEDDVYLYELGERISTCAARQETWCSPAYQRTVDYVKKNLDQLYPFINSIADQTFQENQNHLCLKVKKIFGVRLFLTMGKLHFDAQLESVLANRAYKVIDFTK